MAGARSVPRLAGHLVFILAFVGFWELAAAHGLLDPTFFGRPSGIARHLWRGFFSEGNLWIELGYTALGAAL